VKKKSAKYFFRLLLFSASFILPLLIAEIFYRNHAVRIIKGENNKFHLSEGDADTPFLVTESARGRRLIPNANIIIRNHPFSEYDNISVMTNSLGFRDEEITGKKENEFRILVLGDSIVLGDYLPVEKVFVSRIEHYLNQKQNSVNYQVINASVADIGIKEEIDLLEESGLSTKPDIVAVAFYLNDGRPPWGFPGDSENKSLLRRYSYLVQAIYREFLIRQWISIKGIDKAKWVSLLNNKIKDGWIDDRREFMELVAAAELDWGSAWKDETWSLIGDQFKRLNRLSQNHGFKVLIAAFPVKYQVEADFLENFPQTKLADLTGKYGFTYLDLLPLLRKNKDRELFYDHCHPREFANDLIGNELAQFMTEKYGFPDNNPPVFDPGSN